jgi:hypothetical protein
MAHEVSPNVFCDDLNANFQRGSARIVDGGEEGDKLADVDRLTEGNLVYGQRDDVTPSIAACAGLGNLIQQLQDGAAMHIAGKVCHVRSH